MLRMRQINTTAADLLQGNMRQGHHSVVIRCKRRLVFGKRGGGLKVSAQPDFCRNAAGPVTTHHSVN